VHAAVADPAKVRVGGDLQGDDPAPADGLVMEGAGPLRLERAVLARMLAEARRELAEVQARLAAAEASARDAQAAREAEAAQGQRAQSALAAMAEARDQAVARARSAEDALHVLQRAAAQRQPGAAGIAGLRRRVADLARRQWAALRLRWVNRRGRQAAE
jgi:multidrug efflux pump subunit AcrA (membrane-fusion protein)